MNLSSGSLAIISIQYYEAWIKRSRQFLKKDLTPFNLENLKNKSLIQFLKAFLQIVNRLKFFCLFYRCKRLQNMLIKILLFWEFNEKVIDWSSPLQLSSFPFWTIRSTDLCLGNDLGESTNEYMCSNSIWPALYGKIRLQSKAKDIISHVRSITVRFLWSSCCSSSCYNNGIFHLIGSPRKVHFNTFLLFVSLTSIIWRPFMYSTTAVPHISEFGGVYQLREVMMWWPFAIHISLSAPLMFLLKFLTYRTWFCG